MPEVNRIFPSCPTEARLPTKKNLVPQPLVISTTILTTIIAIITVAEHIPPPPPSTSSHLSSLHAIDISKSSESLHILFPSRSTLERRGLCVTRRSHPPWNLSTILYLFLLSTKSIQSCCVLAPRLFRLLLCGKMGSNRTREDMRECECRGDTCISINSIHYHLERGDTGPI